MNLARCIGDINIEGGLCLSPLLFKSLQWSSMCQGSSQYLSHVDGAHGQRLVAQNGSVLVPLPPLQHDLKLIAFPLQEVRVL